MESDMNSTKIDTWKKTIIITS